VTDALDTRALVGQEAVTSYTQNAEDVRLLRVFRTVSDGFYVDIGAGSPSSGSVTRMFYERGWTGVNVEPGPEYAALVRERPRDVNVEAAVGDADEIVPFFVTYPDPSLSTLDLAAHRDVPDAFERHEEVSVRQLRLESILRRYAAGRRIHFLKIDVEGAEHRVIASCDWREFRPIVVLVEAVESWSTSPTHERWEQALLDAGYEFAVFDGVNRFYVDAEHGDLIPALSYPISALDRFKPAGPSASPDQTDALFLENERLRHENARLRDDLSAVYRSRTWRAGHVLATIFKPVTAVGRRARGRRQRRTTSPEDAYRDAPREGHAKHFPRAGATRRVGRSPLDPLGRELGPPEQPLDRARADGLRLSIEKLGWTDERSLQARRLTREERQVIVEVDALSRVVVPSGGTHDARSRVGRPAVVVDARCLQDHDYRALDAGVHALTVLRATREGTRGMDLLLLVDAELADLPPDVAALADAIVCTPLERSDDVGLFVALSPLTASCAPATPFLAAADCRTIAVVGDLIPADYPSTHLATSVAALAHRARLESLRHYEVLLATSEASVQACRRVLDDGVPTVGGAGDPASVRSRVVGTVRDVLRDRRPSARRDSGAGRARLALVTPFPPQRSGVADYTAVTFREVAKHADVDVYTAASPSRDDTFTLFPMSSAPYLDARYQRVVNVVGNSHFHFPVLDLLESFGGACIAHDISMVEVYGLDDPDPSSVRAGAFGYRALARRASPLLVHGHSLARAIAEATGVAPIVVPFVPYRVPGEPLDESSNARARVALGLRDDSVHIATFGLVDRRTKGHDTIVGALARLRGRNVPAHLHVVGEAPAGELVRLSTLAEELGVSDAVTFHGHVASERLDLFLRAIDVAIQIRTSERLSLSGSAADCFAFGAPTVTTNDLASELDAPSYVAVVRPEASSLQLAEAAESILSLRREAPRTIEDERLAYLSRRSVASYARILLEALEIDARRA
jgi:FkbM family methyltransferase